MAWLSVTIAGLFEVFGVLMINQWNRKRNWKSMLMLVLCFGGSFLFLAIAMQSLPMGIAYAIWTGIGASGGAILGIIFHGEPKDWKRILFIMMIIGSVVGLKLISSE
ncbi:DMT family transporter [Calidifontibacillus erzurumensis]|uniref:Multidrug efflux SMR transporter n=1 Tax=Calidifontibacillus erzurumensis TaxID=2741433 RepID=A0A8J8GFJ2_9BACI|nr:multidrug efflux SMR transporter [Calidifontibacillus erzurumensis]NSL52407.1 multidrug efflux SMR transporter [Calidifontibacillus erzurumensis]